MATAKAKVGAADTANRNVEATGLSLLDNTVKTGRGIAGGSLQAADLALRSGGQAGSTAATQQGTYNASIAPGMSMYQGAVGATTSSGNLFGSKAALETNANSSAMAGLAGLGQTAGMMYGSGMFSSKKLKKRAGRKGKRKGLSDVSDAKILSETPTADKVARLPNEAWRYKDGAAQAIGDDGSVHVGPYAEDVQREFGDRTAPGGQMIDADAMAEHNAAAIAELAQIASRIEQRLGIAA
jgi:hypothetical protein